jgi:hypothetical protein
MRSLPRVVEQGRSSMIYHLYGRERAWVLRAWLDFYREHLGRILEPVFLGNLRRDDLERSEVYQWDYGTRVLLRGAATRFPADGPLLVAREGEWILRPAAGAESLRDLTISPAREDDPAPGITRLPDGAVRVSATEPVRLVMAGGDASLAIEARPVLPEAFTFGPMDTTNYTLDSRCRLEQDCEGSDVAYSPFNTYYSYLLWAEPGEERQLVLRVYPRNRETIGRDLGLKTQAELQRHDPNLWLLVSVDGVHVGAYQLQASDSGDMVRLPLGIRLPPGPHRVAIHGMTPKLGHQPYNPWRWGGLEWNKEWSGEVAPRLEEGGLQFAAAPEPFIPWGDAETGGLSTRIVNPGGPGYARALADEPGAFGRGVLEFDLAMTPEQKRKGYEYILGEPVAVEPGKWFHFGAHLRNLGSQNHHVALAVMFLGANGQPVSPGAMIGNQQKLAPELHTGWVRFTELVPVPRGVARIAPGVIVFPPDTRRTSPAGRIAVDSIYFPTQIEGFARQPDLSDSLFWEVETGDSEVGTD